MTETKPDSSAAQVAPPPQSIAASPNYRTLVRERSRLSWLLTMVIIVVYFGYILLIAFNRNVLARPIGGGTMTLGIPIGIGVILIGIALTGIYVRRANTRFDALTQAIRDEASQVSKP
jgi:uncharacterized membrane protein (DUF485 family)